MKARKPKITKLKAYAALVTAITAVTLAFTALTAYVTYPTADHRRVGQELAKMDAKAFSLDGNNEYEKILKSDKYNELLDSQETTYTMRMGIGTTVLSAIISVAIVVAVYRYLRRNRVTNKPIGATVIVNTIAAAIVLLPAIYIGEIISGIKVEPLTMIMLLISAPFAVGISALITYVIARITEWHYNRSHGFIEE